MLFDLPKTPKPQTSESSHGHSPLNNIKLRKNTLEYFLKSNPLIFYNNQFLIFERNMGASLVYLDRPVTKKETKSGSLPGSQTQVGYKFAASAMQGWRLNMVSYHHSTPLLSVFFTKMTTPGNSYFWRIDTSARVLSKKVGI